jgi:signal peptidase I
MRRIVSAVTTVAVLALAAVAVWFACFSPYKVYIVHTGSMEPTVPVKSAEIVRVGQYQVGRIVSYRFHGEVITHRLVSIASDGTITTKGDANATVDPWHPSTSNIIGEVVAAPHEVGWWLTYFKQPAGTLSAILLLMCFWLAWEVFVEDESAPQDALPEAKTQ